MTTEQALREYLIAHEIIAPELPREDWYKENWVRVPMWGRRVPVFPIYGFKTSLVLHDIHHVLSGYDTDWIGELEIAAWELSSGGCGRYYLYWIDRVVFSLVGLVNAPRSTLRAFRRGLKHRNLFKQDLDAVMSTDFEELQRYTLAPDSARSEIAEGRSSAPHSVT